MKTLIISLFFMISFSFLAKSETVKSENSTRLVFFEVDCDQVALDAYNTIRNQGGTKDAAQNYANRRWHDCVDGGGAHSGNMPPLVLEFNLSLKQN